MLRYSSKDSFMEQTKLSMEDAAASMQASLDSIITREDDNIRYLTYNADSRNHLEHLSQNWTAFTKTLSNDMEPIFWYFITSDSNLDWIRIYSPYLFQSIGNFCHAAPAVETEWWYQESQRNFKTIWRAEGESWRNFLLQRSLRTYFWDWGGAPISTPTPHWESPMCSQTFYRIRSSFC